jgi:hypothetical protein
MVGNDDLPDGMTHAEFTIGCTFTCGGKRWRCTDIGTRVIVAICLEPRDMVRSWYENGERIEEHYLSDDPRDLDGPPYGVVERVFDENDIQACSPLPPAAVKRGDRSH